jgi:hypothetical protein
MVRTLELRKFYFRISYIIPLLALGILISFLVPVNYLLNYFHDDSFFYIKIARNISVGLGSTFDSVNPTNGYHPLWLMILSLLFFSAKFVFGDLTPEFTFRLTLLTEFVLCSMISLFLYKTFALLYKKNLYIFFGVCILLNLAYVFTIDLGMETHLTILLIALYFYCKTIEVKTNTSLVIVKSVLLSCIFLSRTDYLFTLIPVMLIAELFTHWNNKKESLFLIVSILISSSTYFLLNLYLFGDFFAISSHIKNTFPAPVLIYNLSGIFGFFHKRLAFQLIFFIISFSLFLILIIKSREKNPHFDFDLFLSFMLTGTSSFLLLHLFFNGENIKPWYMGSTFFLVTIALTRMLAFDYSKVAVLLIAVFFAFGIIAPRSNQDSAYEYAKDLTMLTKPTDLIYQIDASGIVGLFSERNVINGDGMVNSFEYYEHMKTNRVKEYLQNKNINYYSVYSQFYEESNRIVLTHPTYQVGECRFDVFPSSSLIYRSEETTYFKTEKMHWLLFKFD